MKGGHFLRQWVKSIVRVKLCDIVGNSNLKFYPVILECSGLALNITVYSGKTRSCWSPDKHEIHWYLGCEIHTQNNDKDPKSEENWKTPKQLKKRLLLI